MQKTKWKDVEARARPSTDGAGEGPSAFGDWAGEEAHWAELVDEELAAASDEVRAVVVRARDRVMEMVRVHVRRSLEDALESARQTLASRPGITHVPPLAAECEGGAGPSQTPGPTLDGKEGSASKTVEEPAGPLMLRQTAHAGGAGEDNPPGDTEQPKEVQPMVSPQLAAPAAKLVEEGEELCTGTVRLDVQADGCLRLVVQFVEALCVSPQLRLLKLVGSHMRTGVGVWVSLREPVRLRSLLTQIEGVSRVEVPEGHTPREGERLFRVLLSEAAPAP